MVKEKAERTEIGIIGEFGLINRLTKDFQLVRKSTFKGVGDDAAIIVNGDKHTLITTDSLLEGIHFDLMYMPLMHLGYKAVVVNLSDIYAMNGTPGQITVSISISNRFSVEAVEEIYKGIYQACKNYDVDLVGGDTTSSPKGLFLNICAIGTVEESKIVLRSGARPGDLICVSGDLGAAYLGLQLLEREKQLFESDPNMQPELEGHAYVLGRQLRPEAQKDIIELLDKSGILPTAMIDISDGLASDILHICKDSGVGADILEAQVPIHPEAELTALEFKLDPITCALSGGEDYELLFTVDPEDYDKIKYMTGFSIIGEITEKSNGVKLITSGGNEHEIQAQGWRHFDH